MGKMEVITQNHKPCAFNPGGASKDFCRNVSRVPIKNQSGCTTSNCCSPWRFCAVCILQTGEPRTVQKPGDRLCQFHKENGERAITPQQVRGRTLIPTTKFSTPQYLNLPPAKPAAEAEARDQKTARTASRQTPVPQVEPSTRNVPPPPAVASRSEGREILDRVRLAISEATYEIVDVGRIRPMPGQPRTNFNPERLRTLAESIKSVGQIMPGYLREAKLDAEGHDRELVDGERRWRAILMSGVSTFRAMLVKIDDEAAQYIVSTIANFNREGHTVLEIADAIRVMHERLKLTINEIADSIGFSREYVSNLYGLRRLTPEVRAMLEPDIDHNRQLPISIAIEIARIPQEHQGALAKRVQAKEVTARTLRREIAKLSKQYGLPSRTTVLQPNQQRRDITRKIEMIARSADDLGVLFGDATDAVLRGWPSDNIDWYLKKLEQTAELIHSASERLKRIRSAGRG